MLEEYPEVIELRNQMEDWKRRYDVYVANFEHAKKGCKRLTTNQIDEISNDKRGLLGAITDI